MKSKNELSISSFRKLEKIEKERIEQIEKEINGEDSNTAPLWQILNSITTKKNNAYKDLGEAVVTKNIFMVNRWLSQREDTCLFAQFINEFPNIPTKMKFDFYFYSLPKMYRKFNYAKGQKIKDSDVEAVKEYFRYNNNKALDALDILTEEQLKKIHSSLNKGGMNG